MINLNTVYSETEAKVVAFAIKAGYFGEESGYERDAANGALEAYFVSELRAVSKENLGTRLEALKANFGTMNAFKRAVGRVKEFRGKNPAWRTFSL
jgi:hypothetical protein